MNEVNPEETAELAGEVEKIVAKAMIEGRIHYQVKWQGSEEMTWEPMENLEGVTWLIEEFECAMRAMAGGGEFEGWE